MCLLTIQQVKFLSYNLVKKIECVHTVNLICTELSILILDNQTKQKMSTIYTSNITSDPIMDVWDMFDEHDERVKDFYHHSYGLISIDFPVLGYLNPTGREHYHWDITIRHADGTKEILWNVDISKVWICGIAKEDNTIGFGLGVPPKNVFEFHSDNEGAQIFNDFKVLREKIYIVFGLSG